MGSLRNPIGPLPSSIYWRRRAVLLSLVAVLGLLVIWAVTASGGDGKNAGSDDSDNGQPPAGSITPGPSGTGPAISQHPGGRDETGTGGGSGDDTDTGGGSGGDGSGGTGTTGSGGSAGEDNGGGTEGSSGAGGNGGSAAGGSGDRLPAGSTLATCPASSVRLALRSIHNSYAPGDRPRLELSVRNSSGQDCKFDLGAGHTALTITQTGTDDALWSAGDCPKGDATYFVRVPAGGTATRTVEWNRNPSAPHCAAAKGGPARLDTTYLVEARAPGVDKAQASFRLAAD